MLSATAGLVACASKLLGCRRLSCWVPCFVRAGPRVRAGSFALDIWEFSVELGDAGVDRDRWVVGEGWRDFRVRCEERSEGARRVW